MVKVTKTDKQWLEQLGEYAFQICRQGATEAPFSGELLHIKESGEYVCNCCGQTLFYSETMFDSGCGWPSFDSSATTDSLRYIEDTSHQMHRTEVRCFHCDAHLGHLFDDGPTDTGLRYCINSTALQFEAEDSLDDDQ